jgi:hypothetical protein
MLVYLIGQRPFEEDFMNKLEMFNELAILLVSYHLFMITDFNPDVIRQYNVGWSIIVITAFNIGTNMVIMII